MTDTLITDVQIALIDEVDSTALNVVIWDYLNNPNNGFMDQEELITIIDATACTVVYTPTGFDATSVDLTSCVFIDTTETTFIDTTSLWTVQQWKNLYLETTNNDAMKTLDRIAYTDSRSPNNPLVDWNNDLYSFDTTSSVDFSITEDSTSENYIQYEYRTAEKVDGMYIQQGLNGIDSTSGLAEMAYYIGYSSNGDIWNYILDDNGTPGFGNQQVAIANPFYISIAEADMLPQVVEDIMFTDTAIEAKYWRIYFVEGTLGSYIASISHLRFQQIREHGDAVVPHTVKKDRTVGVFSTGDSVFDSSVSGSGWFVSGTFTITARGVREQSCQLVGRFWADSTCDVKVTVEEYAGATEVIVDSWSLDDRGFITLTDGRDLTNPAADVSDDWVFKYRIYDKSDFETPATEFRFSLMTTFRSSQET